MSEDRIIATSSDPRRLAAWLLEGAAAGDPPPDPDPHRDENRRA